MKKIISLLVAMVLVVATFSGCASTKSSKGDSSASSSGPVTITYALWDSNQQKGLETMAQEFEAKNPNIKIKFQVVGWSNYWTMLDAAATGGSLPDVFWMHSNEIYKYASNGMLYDLTKLISSSKSVSMKDFPKGLVDIYNFKGKQYAVPKDYDTIGLWYNKTMFDKAGLKYPDETWTWDTLYNAAKKLTSNGVYGFLAPLHNQEGYYNFVYQNGGTIIKNENGKKTSGYDDPKTVEAMKFYLSFVKDGLSPKVYGDAERAQDMENGLCAMGLFGSWNLSGFTSNDYMKKNFDVAVLPSSNSGKRASIFNGLGNAISHNTKHPKEAWKWVEYLGSKEGQTRQAQLGVAISAYNGTSDAWVDSNKTFHTKCFIDMVKYAQIRPYSNTTATWEDKAYEQLKGAFTGEKTVDKACSDAAKIMNDSLSTEK